MRLSLFLLGSLLLLSVGMVLATPLFESVVATDSDAPSTRNSEEQLIVRARAPSRKENGTLPKFTNIGNFYTAGVSSGGYMAGQLHVAYSSLFSGVGIFAAGPWGCAEGSLEKALAACTDDSADLGLAGLITAAEAASAIGTIDPITNMQGAPVWIFHGISDATVKRPVADAGAEFYYNFGANVLYNNKSEANHAWVSPMGANPCSVSESPYTSNCGPSFDPPGEMLAHIMQKKINGPNQGELTGQLSPFSQDFYTLAKWGLEADMLSMDSTGYVYVPAACSNNTTACDVVMVFHGCEQSVSIVGMDLIQQAEMNQYADSNNFIVVYPQTIALTLGVVLNPKACWDWWGYLATDALYANHGSYQMEVLVSMLKALKA